MKKELFALVGLLLATLFISCNFPGVKNKADNRFAAYLNYEKPLASLLPVKPDTEQVSIKISKSDYRLSVLYKEEVLKEYPVVFGFDPVSDKRREGDGCTPEGEFRLRSVYHHDKWSRFMWVDYPTEESWVKHRTSKSAGEIPEDATIGGEIGIHGVPNNMNSLISERENWTLGCISMTNPDVEEIYAFSRVGTSVSIVP